MAHQSSCKNFIFGGKIKEITSMTKVQKLFTPKRLLPFYIRVGSLLPFFALFFFLLLRTVVLWVKWYIWYLIQLSNIS